MVDCLVSPSSVHQILPGSVTPRGCFAVRGLRRTASNCLYNPATHAAVGGWRTSYVADFCNETSNDIYYGVAGPGQTTPMIIGAGPKCPGFDVGCHAPLAEASCPPTWQEAQVEPWLCTFPAGIVHFGHAAGLLARSVNPGFSHSLVTMMP